MVHSPGAEIMGVRSHFQMVVRFRGLETKPASLENAVC
jgi:hypothetical protein